MALGAKYDLPSIMTLSAIIGNLARAPSTAKEGVVYRMADMRRDEKRKFVREAIYAAAIEMFAARGFDEPTVEEIAQAAGVSRRSFFRYFASKDDLLAQTAVSYGEVLRNAVNSCPRTLSPLEVIRATVRAGVEHAAAPEVRTRQVVEIAIGSESARQAYQSRSSSIEDSLASAFAVRTKKRAVVDAESRMLAGVTLAVMNATVASWFSGEHETLPGAASRVLKLLVKTVKENSREPVKSAPIH
jgi:AcrR family transcriptional regulator